MRIISRSTLLWVILNSAAAAWPCGSARADEASKKRLLTEGPPAIERLKKKFSQIHGSGVEVVTGDNRRRMPRAEVVNGNLPAVQAELERNRIDFQLDGKSRKMVVHRLFGGKPDAFKIETTCESPDLSFILGRASADGEPVIESVARRGVTFLTLNVTTNNYLNAPCTTSILLKDIFARDEKAATLVDVTPLERDGRKLLKVEFNRHIKTNNGVREFKDSLILAPDEKWAVQEFETRIGNGFRNTRIEYGPEVDGFPTPKRVVITTLTTRTTFEFTEFQFGPSPAADFTPAAAGVPDLKVPEAPQTTPKPEA
jgi:hypothetical protein